MSTRDDFRSDFEVAARADRGLDQPTNPINHPAHYGGEADPYEAIKVIEAWQLGFCLGNTLKYLCRAGQKGSRLEDLLKAAWYLQREIQAEQRREQEQERRS